MCCRYGDLEAVEDFLAIGRDVNACDDKKRSPLHYSVAYWKPGVADALLEAGADVEAQVRGLNRRGENPVNCNEMSCDCHKM
jgi:ankyrin repeat protein